MAKKKHKWIRWGIPGGLLLLLGLWALLGSPSVKGVEQEGVAALERSGAADLEKDRHYGPVQLDSLVGLIRRIDPEGKACAWKLESDSLWIEQQPGYPVARFRRIFLGQRSADDLSSWRGLPVRMVRGKKEGYVAPLMLLGGVDYVEIPYALLTGLLAEWEGMSAGRQVKSKP